MERQRIIQAMWLTSGNGYTLHDEPHPVMAFRVYEKHLPIKIEECVERCIAPHLLSLSQSDKPTLDATKGQPAVCLILEAVSHRNFFSRLMTVCK